MCVCRCIYIILHITLYNIYKNKSGLTAHAG